MSRTGSQYTQAIPLSLSPVTGVGKFGDELFLRRRIPGFRVDGEDRAPRRRVRKREEELPVEPPGTPKRRVDRVQTVRRADHDHLEEEEEEEEEKEEEEEEVAKEGR